MLSSRLNLEGSFFFMLGDLIGEHVFLFFSLMLLNLIHKELSFSVGVVLGFRNLRFLMRGSSLLIFLSGEAMALHSRF
ncbi:MAG: hypothetical protein UW09_C0004G0091 [candidate division TM6 bacterium GW2011_GWF2_43_87]|nr:MAG: hypothetical protein UW09_C0004G0091 [candidate division TM6 bacterium GW2011_GWF2_43_87]